MSPTKPTLLLNGPSFEVARAGTVVTTAPNRPSWPLIGIVILGALGGWAYHTQRDEITALTEHVDTLTKRTGELEKLAVALTTQEVSSLRERVDALTVQNAPLGKLTAEMKAKLDRVCFKPKPNAGELLAPC